MKQTSRQRYRGGQHYHTSDLKTQIIVPCPECDGWGYIKEPLFGGNIPYEKQLCTFCKGHRMMVKIVYYEFPESLDDKESE